MKNHQYIILILQIYQTAAVGEIQPPKLHQMLGICFVLINLVSKVNYDALHRNLINLLFRVSFRLFPVLRSAHRYVLAVHMAGCWLPHYWIPVPRKVDPSGFKCLKQIEFSVSLTLVLVDINGILFAHT